MRITIEEDNIDMAQRLTQCDNAFGLLWDIDMKCRDYQKYGTKKTKLEILAEIRELIQESHLMDLYK